MDCTPSPCARHRFVVAAAFAALTSAAVGAELTQIEWDPQGRFESALTVAPGKFAEICGKLAKGQRIAWSFTGEWPMAFNVHYHEGKKVEFPVKQNDVASLNGTLAVPLDQDYCWMWENRGARPAVLTLKLRRE